MASIAWAIKMPTLKTSKKMSNQVLTATSVLEVNLAVHAQSKASRREPRFQRRLRIHCHTGRLSSERKKKECADDGGREKWKPNVRHFRGSDSLRRIKCAPRS